MEARRRLSTSDANAWLADKGTRSSQFAIAAPYSVTVSPGEKVRGPVIAAELSSGMVVPNRRRNVPSILSINCGNPAYRAA